MNDPPEVTIVMPVRNEARSIEETLRLVLDQEVDAPFEVVVADGRSTDDTRALVEAVAARDSRVRLVDNPAGGTPQALNRALEAARGRYLVRVDGHSAPPPGYVQRLLDHLRSGECDGAGGRKIAVGTSEFGRAVAAAHGSRFGIGDSRYHFGGAVEYVDHVPFGAYATELARRIGGWDETFVRNQDYEFDYRFVTAGGRLLLDPSISIDWNVRESPQRLAKQYYEYGYWRFRSLARHPSSLHARWLVPPTLATALAVGAATSWTRPGRLLLGAAATSYGAVLAVGAHTLAQDARWKPSRARSAAALACMHLPWGAGFALSAARYGAGALIRRLR